MISVIKPIWAKLRPYSPFHIGYSAGTSDCIMSLRKCEKLSASMTENAAPSAIRRLSNLGCTEPIVLMHLLR